MTTLHRFHEILMTLLVRVILEFLALTARPIDPVNDARKRSQQIRDKRHDQLVAPVEPNHRVLWNPAIIAILNQINRRAGCDCSRSTGQRCDYA